MSRRRAREAAQYAPTDTAPKPLARLGLMGIPSRQRQTVADVDAILGPVFGREGNVDYSFPTQTGAISATAPQEVWAVFGVALRAMLREAVAEAVHALREELAASITLQPAEAASTNPNEMLTVAEAAVELKVEPATVRDWIRADQLPAVTMGPSGREYRIRRSAIEAFLRGPSKEVAVDDAAEVTRILGKTRNKQVSNEGE